jgi:hypothetical protein
MAHKKTCLALLGKTFLLFFIGFEVIEIRFGTTQSNNYHNEETCQKIGQSRGCNPIDESETRS